MKRLALAVIVSALFFTAPTADAAIIRDPGFHDSSVEVELHGVARWFDRNDYGWGAIGAGLRIGIPIIQNGFIPRINNMVDINFGGDLLLWGDGYINLVVPVTLQWNFYITGTWSVFAEAGFAVEWYPGLPPGHPFTDVFGFWPGLAVGTRIHFGHRAGYPALTFRLGFPNGVNVGVSF